jgi:hypothetical protein
MKRKYQIQKKAGFIAMALCAASCAALAQGPGGDGGPGPGGPPPGRPPLPPVIRALDANYDGVIDASEIANAPQELSTLLKSGSTSLSIHDLLGGPPRRHRGGPEGGGPPDVSGSSGGNTDDGPPPPPPDGPPPGGPGGGDDQGGPPPPPPGGPGGPGGHHRPPPVIQALDANHDGVVDTNEISNSPQELSTLLKSGSTSLSIPDLLGPPPRRGHGPGGPGGPGGSDGDDGPPGPPPDDGGPSQSGSNGQTDAPPPPPPPQ